LLLVHFCKVNEIILNSQEDIEKLWLLGTFYQPAPKAHLNSRQWRSA